MTLVKVPDTENELENPDRAGSQHLDNIGSEVDNEQQVTTHSDDAPELSPTGLPSSNFFFEPADDSDELNGTAHSTASTLVSSAERPENILASLSGKRPGYTSSLSGSSNTMSSMTRPQLSIKRPSHSVQPLQTGSEEKKMHQTSTRIMRTTPDGRPFAREFHDLFATLMVSLNLRTHRSRFRSFPFSFTTDEAVNDLANLKFAQSNRMPDPNDPSRVVTTTTTTTFSMAKDMAKALCQRFMDARFFEAASDRGLDVFRDKTIWMLTPKGVCKLRRFVARNGIVSEAVSSLLAAGLGGIQLIILERDGTTDSVLSDKSVVELVFRRFAGRTPNTKSSNSNSEVDAVSAHADGLVGVKLVESRRFGDQVVHFSFTGRSAISWLTDCTTVLDPDEAHELAEMFLAQGLIAWIGDARGKIPDGGSSFQGSKTCIYHITLKGQRIAGWEIPRSESSTTKTSPVVPTPTLRRQDNEEDSTESVAASTVAQGRDQVGIPNTKETNTNRLNIILEDPGLRSQFREFLRENYCEENLTFYLDMREFAEHFGTVQDIDAVSEGLARAYSIYNAYLASGSPCELNLDHQLRLEIVAQMTQSVANDEASMLGSLEEVARLYDRAQQQVFRLMAGDSVPKFMKDPLYLELVEDHHGEQPLNA